MTDLHTAHPVFSGIGDELIELSRFATLVRGDESEIPETPGWYFLTGWIPDLVPETTNSIEHYPDCCTIWHRASDGTVAPRFTLSATFNPRTQRFDSIWHRCPTATRSARTLSWTEVVFTCLIDEDVVYHIAAIQSQHPRTHRP